MDSRPTSPSHDDSANDLHWHAFRYVACEMSESEGMRFEALLAEGQAAREAVARAVELTQAAAAAHQELPVGPHAAAPPLTLSSREKNWLQPLTWMAAGAAVCLGFVLLSFSQVAERVLPDGRGRDVAQQAVNAADALSGEEARLWSQVRDEVLATIVAENWGLEGGPAHEALLFAPLEQLDQETDEDTNEDEVQDVPSWMIAAVGGPADAMQPAAEIEEN